MIMIGAPTLEIAIVLLGTGLLLLEAFSEKIEKEAIAYAAIIGLVVVFIGSFFVSGPPADHSSAFWNFYTADPLAIFFKRFAIVTTIFVLVMMLDYAPTVRTSTFGVTAQSGLGEFFALPLFTCAGLMWIASAIDFVMIFVSIELVSVSFYVLVSFTRRNPATLEAGVKYLILSAVATGFLVYGITWIFGVTGETNLDRMTAALTSPEIEVAPALFGIVLILIALGFKIAAVPLQIWVPDVYQGAPTPVTAYLSVGSKAAGFVVLLRVLRPFFVLPQVQRALVVVAILTLIYGNLAALPQNNLKRLLAYSSIAHSGYILIGIVSFSGIAVSFYLVAYLVMTLLSFAVLIIVANNTGEQIQDFNGLGKRSPFLAFAMLLAMISLAGVPFTAGFIGKFLVFDAAIQHRQFALAGVGVITVGCGFYYYLKVVRAMYWQAPSSVTPISITGFSRLAMLLLMIANIWLGIYPQPILQALTR